jgi:small subunit ribosomal protein S3
VGQKTHPYGFRLVYNKPWHSRWYAERDYADLLQEDLALREDLKLRLSHAGVSEIDIERAADRLRVTIYTSRPGIVIGRKGAEVDKLRDDLKKRVKREVHINIQEIQRPELDAQLVAQNLAGQLQRRIAFRRAMKKAMEAAFRFGAKHAQGRHRLRLCRVEHDLRHHRMQGLDLQGRSAAREAAPGIHLAPTRRSDEGRGLRSC